MFALAIMRSKYAICTYASNVILLLPRMLPFAVAARACTSEYSLSADSVSLPISIIFSRHFLFELSLEPNFFSSPVSFSEVSFAISSSEAVWASFVSSTSSLCDFSALTDDLAF